MDERPAADGGRWTRGRPSPFVQIAAVVVGAILGLAAATLWNASQPTYHESTVRLLVGPIGGERTTLDAAGLLSTTYAELVTSRSVVTRVSEDLGIPIDPEDVTARADDQSRVILLTARSEDPAVPPPVADALAAELQDIVEGQPAPAVEVAAGSEAGQVRVLDPATDPAEEVRDASTLIAVALTLLGAGLGMLWARAPRSITRTIDERFLESLELPLVIARAPVSIEHDRHDTWDLAATQIDYECRRTGTYQTIVHIPVDDDPDLVNVFVQLVAAEARTGRPVQILDADPHHDAIGRLLPALGVYSDWERQAEERLGPEVVATTEGEGDLLPPGATLHFVKSRPFADAPGAMARLQRVADRLPAACLLAALAPPVGAAPAAVSTAVVVDRAVLVVRRGRTRRREVLHAMRALDSVGVRPAVVLELERGLHLEPVDLSYRSATPIHPEPSRTEPSRTE